MKPKILCLGTGLLGRSWAIVFARRGFPVILHDRDARRMHEAVDWISQTVRHGSAGLHPEGSELPGKVAIAEDLASALADVDIVIESVYEDPVVKRGAFEALDSLAARPDAIFCSSTSGLPGSSFMSGLGISPRCLVAHPVNPPHLVPLVEMCRTTATTDAAFACAMALMHEVGQTPVVINRELNGYALNRLQAAVLREAMHLVHGGYLSARDLDLVMSHGLGRRWTLMGPLATAHLNSPGGFREYMTKFANGYQSIMDDLRTDLRLTQALVNEVADAVEAVYPPGDVAGHQSRRDRQLAALNVFLEGSADGS